MNRSEFGVIGLGVMGKSLSLNFADKGFSISVYNRAEGDEKNIVKYFLQKNMSFKNISGYTDIKTFVLSLEKPRKILLMIKAGNAIDAVIKQLIQVLDPGDIIIDGGNSFFLDTKTRQDELLKKEIHFMSCGISGGEEGARKGPSMMVSGNKENYELLAPYLEAIAARDINKKPCCSLVANGSAGHFVKMIHNGIEYSEMQLLAELYSILSINKTNKDISELFASWNKTDLSSYLLEITAAILNQKEGNTYVVDTILDKAGNKGTGSWSSKTSLEIGFPATMITSAVFARYLSSFKEQRVSLSKLVPQTKSSFDLDFKTLENAYRFAKITNHQQGFNIIANASVEYGWKVNLSELARIWTNGCIIRSKLMQHLSELFKTKKDMFENDVIIKTLKTSEVSVANLIKSSITNRIPLDTFWSAYNYWTSMTTEKLPANLIQAQRDYFGAHTYQKIDAPLSQYFHTNWKIS